MIESRLIILRIRNVTDDSSTENQNTYFMFNNLLFRKSCRLGDNVELDGRATHATDGNIMRHVRFECWIPKATDTHSEYVILIPFPQREMLSSTPLSVLYNLIKRCITHEVERVSLNNLTISTSYLLSYRGFVKL